MIFPLLVVRVPAVSKRDTNSGPADAVYRDAAIFRLPA